MFKKIKSERLPLIASSLVIAVCLWAYIVGEEAIEVTKKVPLTIETAEGFTVANELPQTVTVRFSVPRNLLAILENQPINVIHSLTEIRELGQFSFDLTPQDVKRPSSVIQVLQIMPQRIVVTLDEVIHKRLPIVANLSNEPAAGFKVDKENIQIDPNAVLVSGAKSTLEKIESVRTETIDIIGRIRSFRKKVILEEKRDYQIVNKSLIDVYVPIKEEISSKTYKKVPIKIMNAARSTYDIEINPETVDFSLKGPLNSIESIKEEAIMAYVNIVDLTPGKYQLPLLMNLPGDVTPDKTNPVIDVTIKERAAAVSIPRSVSSNVPKS